MSKDNDNSISDCITTKKPRHRPTSYKPEYCDMLVNHMAKGFSYESFAGTINSTRENLYIWERNFKDFLHSKKLGFEKCRIFWENIGISHIINRSEYKGGSKSLNAAIWIFNMKNRFGWSDKIDITQESRIQITIGTDQANKINDMASLDSPDTLLLSSDSVILEPVGDSKALPTHDDN